MFWAGGKGDSRIVSAISIALVFGEADLVDAVDVVGVVHCLAEIIVEFGSGEPVLVVVVCVLDYALFSTY